MLKATILLAATAFAQNPGQSLVTAIDLAGKRISGTLKSVSDDRLSLGNQTLKVSDLLRLEIGKKQNRAYDLRSVVFLENGDRLVATPVSMDEESVLAKWNHFESWPPVRVPLETIRGMILNGPAGGSARTRLMNSLLDHSQKNDFLILNNGDHVTGELSGLDQNAFSLIAAGGQTNIERDGVRAVGFNSELISFPKSDKRRALITLTDGSRITARNLKLDSEGRFRFDALLGAKLSVPVSALVSVRFLGGRAVYLSDLKPARYEFTPYLSTRWELKKDRNVAGGPLRLRGREYAKGLGLHSKCEVVYELGGRFVRFQAVVGIDDSTAGRGSVTLAIELDGKRVFSSGLLTGKSKPLPVGPIDVTGAKRMSLIVDYAQFGDIQDRVDWCDAVLVTARRPRTERPATSRTERR